MKPESLVAEVVVPHPCLLGEGVFWDGDQNAVCWVDILQGELHQFQPATKNHHIIQLHDLVGTAVLCTNGDFLAALKHGIAHVRRVDGVIRMLVNPEKSISGNRFNDGKCDPAGRLWVGSIGLTEDTGVASLYKINPDLSFAKMLGNVTISNGLAWTSDSKTFYYIDTPTMEVAAFDFNLEQGSISNKRVVITVPQPEGYPDGMTIDTEGMLWIAHWDGWQVARWDPRTGKKLLSIKLPVARVSCCSFGGQNLDDLYITTARKELTPQQLAEQPLAGQLFVVRNCGFRGKHPFRFTLDSAVVKE